ncbi:tRNA pseudouridine55 synthase [Alkalibacillus filiformis]|uniref:tRNA pseudouridine synthase B n=1 Tax=Alkalibacillus filiformis TaxID=200990 RepID=A0ABU0DQS7_9BACI|nr:tRNA pseudouridine(55) synthase TruB [Alkalibacillus filiformis]MDQ0350668.1 tRNA pseudouridine55 synthase [Alkalibacillus filiformis]
MNGIIPLWKPKGMTSHDCVMKLRGILRTKKVGHTGTLDPEVEGVLPITVGKATKLTTLITDHPKTYVAEVSLGKQTTTEDYTGEVVDQKNISESLTLEHCEGVLKHFEGTITQVPPMYSAVKVNGMKLYEYAREGLEVERPNREVTIYNISNLSDQLKIYNQQDVRFSFQATCSSGTYIRTLCVDIGKKLGYPAHMSHLVREEAGSFKSNESVTFEQLEAAKKDEGVEKFIVSPSKPLSYLPTYIANTDEIFRFKNGQVLSVPSTLKEVDLFRVEDELGHLIALYQQHPTKAGQIKPFKVLQS